MPLSIIITYACYTYYMIVDLDLDLEGIRFIFSLYRYDPEYIHGSGYDYYKWCHTDITIVATSPYRGNWLHYQIMNDQKLMCHEVDSIISAIQDYLDGKFSDEDPHMLSFTEPDLVFEMGREDFSLSIFFWDNRGSAIGSNLKLCFYKKEDVRILLDYLLLATDKAKKDDERIRHLIDERIIRIPFLN